MTAEKVWWEPIWAFAVHSIVGTTVFVLIAVPAILLNVAIKWLGERNVSPYLLGGLACAEYLLFTVDLLLFVIFIIRTARRAVREL